MSENIYKSGFYNTGLTVADVQDIINNTPNIKNVQPDWNETSNTSDAFIKNKPVYEKYSSDNDVIYKVATVTKAGENNGFTTSIEFLTRAGYTGLKATLIIRNDYSLKCVKSSGTYSTANFSTEFYISESGNFATIYVKCGKYVRLFVSPDLNLPKDRIDFTNFGEEVAAIPAGSVLLSPVWIASATSSSGNAPVKTDFYGNLTPVTMDNYPTSASTGLVNSGNLYSVFTDDNGDQMTEAPPQQYYVTGKFYFVAGKICRCTAYSAATATFDVYGVVEALNYVLSQT